MRNKEKQKKLIKNQQSMYLKIKRYIPSLLLTLLVPASTFALESVDFENSTIPTNSKNQNFNTPLKKQNTKNGARKILGELTHNPHTPTKDSTLDNDTINNLENTSPNKLYTTPEPLKKCEKHSSTPPSPLKILNGNIGTLTNTHLPYYSWEPGALFQQFDHLNYTTSSNPHTHVTHIPATPTKPQVEIHFLSGCADLTRAWFYTSDSKGTQYREDAICYEYDRVTDTLVLGVSFSLGGQYSDKETGKFGFYAREPRKAVNILFHFKKGKKSQYNNNQVIVTLGYIQPKFEHYFSKEVPQAAQQEFMRYADSLNSYEPLPISADIVNQINSVLMQKFISNAPEASRLPKPGDQITKIISLSTQTMQDIIDSALNEISDQVFEALKETSTPISVQEITKLLTDTGDRNNYIKTPLGQLILLARLAPEQFTLSDLANMAIPVLSQTMAQKSTILKNSLLTSSQLSPANSQTNRQIYNTMVNKQILLEISEGMSFQLQSVFEKRKQLEDYTQTTTPAYTTEDQGDIASILDPIEDENDENAHLNVSLESALENIPRKYPTLAHTPFSSTQK